MSFKVGDRVKGECKHGNVDKSVCRLDGLEGTISGWKSARGDSDKRLYLVDYPGDYGSNYFPEERLTLVGTAPTLVDKLTAAISKAELEYKTAVEDFNNAVDRRDTAEERIKELEAVKTTLLTL